MRARRVSGFVVVVISFGSLATVYGVGLPTPEESARVGKELFTREWAVNDPRTRGGDGLGPVFNERSCVACHFLGGTGGAGPNDKNVEIVTASVRLEKNEDAADFPRTALIEAHPAFRTSNSVVLHREGTDSRYESWRKSTRFGTFGRFTLATTERNTPALFGLGLIDAIPDSVIERQSRRSDPNFPQSQGRAAKTEKGRVGKFGWKGQTASLNDFVRTACAVELGLEVPGHPQSPDPRETTEKAPGLDLSDGECDALVNYVASLPRPIFRVPFDSLAARSIQEGRELFESVGCASCHTPKLGEVEGIYSDLLLHDMGKSLRDSAAYYGITPPKPTDAPPPVQIASRAQPADEDEWRTPPLWGLHDSGPYLHDGRAPTVERAILAHGGSAQPSTDLYKKLSHDSRRSLLTFLNSLVAPKPAKTPSRPAPIARTGSIVVSGAK